MLRCGFVGYGREDDEWYFATDEDNVAKSDAFRRWEALSSLEKQQRKKALDVEEAGLERIMAPTLGPTIYP